MYTISPSIIEVGIMRLVNVIKKHYVHTLHNHILTFELNQYHNENYTIILFD